MTMTPCNCDCCRKWREFYGGIVGELTGFPGLATRIAHESGATRDTAPSILGRNALDPGTPAPLNAPACPTCGAPVPLSRAAHAKEIRVWIMDQLARNAMGEYGPEVPADPDGLMAAIDTYIAGALGAASPASRSSGPTDPDRAASGGLAASEPGKIEHGEA